MNEGGKSDRFVVPANPPNKATAAEVGEGRWRAKGNTASKTRPGHSAGTDASSALEDKIVQRAVVEVLGAVCEVDFRGFSYGFRPRRGQHDALDALAVGIRRKRVNWAFDADIRDFFSRLDRSWLRRFLGHRIADQRVLRLIDKWLAAGVVEDEQWSPTLEGSPQG